ncbi:hypothetical protein [Streptomyces sp. NBC_01361]|uniref:hypothetical protein n=1 Tax=Streptomyces sp. NBC_01361 TaxID=2903838 RepID=UPI002E2EBC90|nr:hypothetical protein [Streptomyces sp. NBC_01361]
MSVHTPASALAPTRTAPTTPATFHRKRPTVLSYGLGADSTAILLMFLADPAAHGLEPDLSDLTVIHAVTGDEFADSIDYVNRLVLPLLRARSVRLVQVCRGGKSDTDGVLVLDDTRAPRRIHSAGPWRLSDELRAAGTVPQLANGQRRCSLRFKGWVLDHWAASEFGSRTFRRVIGYHADELGRAEKDTAVQRRLNTDAGRTICEPHYPLILARMDRRAVEAHVLASLGEPIKKSYCSMCPFSGVCASRDRHEERLRAHPHVAADVLRLEHVSMALNEQMSLYGPAGSLYRRLTEDGRNRAVLDAFQASLDQALHAVYEVRRITFVGRTKDCRSWHGKKCAEPKWWCSWQRTARCRRLHTVVDQDGAPIGVEPQCSGADRCRGKQQKGQTWRSVRTVWEGPRERAELIVGTFAERFPERVRLVTGSTSKIRRAHYLPDAQDLPRAEAFIVAAPAGVADKQRSGFEGKWTEHTGGKPVFPPLRELPQQARRKRAPGGPALVRQAQPIGGTP